MARVYEYLPIDMKNNVHNQITVQQNDANSRYLDVVLTDNGAPVDLTDHKVRMVAIKSDGKPIFNNCKVTVPVNGQFEVKLTRQALAVPGEIRIQFKVYTHDETCILTTPECSITIKASMDINVAVESTTEFSVLDKSLIDVARFDERIKHIEESVATNIIVNTSLGEKVNALLPQLDAVITKVNGLPPGSVKNIQRGVFTWGGTGTTSTNIVLGTAINASKSYATVGEPVGQAGAYAVFKSLSNTALTFEHTSGGNAGNRCNWEVIEFY